MQKKLLEMPFNSLLTKITVYLHIIVRNSLNTGTTYLDHNFRINET